MDFLKKIWRLSANLLRPFNDYGAFIVFMYVLGLVCVYAVVPAKRGYHAYSLAPRELFVDGWLRALVLWALPKQAGLLLKRAWYFV